MYVAQAGYACDMVVRLSVDVYHQHQANNDGRGHRNEPLLACQHVFKLG
jgi:hypothetical protein